MTENLPVQEELTALRQEVRELQTYKQAFTLYEELSTAFVSLRQHTSGGLLLKTMLRQTLELVARLTAAEESSLFWLNEDGIVTESILARGVVIREQKQSVIGQVLEQGLAGWVYRHRQVGLIEDTETDSRWIQLLNQPYVARSALCIPIIRGKTFLAIITLTHSQPHYFSQELVETIQVCTAQIALVLDQLRFNLQLDAVKDAHVSPAKPSPQKLEELKETGIFFLNQYANFVYMNPPFAKIFGYSLADLVALSSFYNLISQEHRSEFQLRFHQCFEGQLEEIQLSFKGVCQDGALVPVQLCGYKTKLYGQYLLVGIVYSPHVS